MRWSVLALLAACQFTPGTLSAGPGSGFEDAAIDGRTTDAAVDTPVSLGPPFVRMIDPTDAMIAGGPHVDFPLLISLTTPWLKSTTNGGDVARDDGFDIFFSSDKAGTTPLTHEVEAYDPVAGTLVAWVKLTLAADTQLYIHYGDTTLTTNPSMPAGVFASSFQAVLHMSGAGDATAKNTANATAVAAATGKIGPAWSFDGSTSYIDVGSNAAIDSVFSGGGTVEAWFNPASFGENQHGRIFDKGYWLLLVDNTTAASTVSFLRVTNNNGGFWNAPANSITASAWNHVALVYDDSSTGNDPVFYVNGAPVTTTEGSTPTGSISSDNGATLFVGDQSGGGRAYDGVLDELRVSSTSLSAGWISTEYANQNDPSSFYTVSAPL